MPTSGQALEKAVSTVVPVHNDSAKFLKGVAQTATGWKVTYVAYRSYDETGTDVPLVRVILQPLDAASDENWSGLNERIFEATNRGDTILPAIMELDGP